MFFTPLRIAARFAHHVSVAAPKESLVEQLQKRLTSVAAVQVSNRLEQLKRNHMKFLSLDVNWNVLKPEQKEAHLRELETLVHESYEALDAEKKKQIKLASVFQVNPETDFKLWDKLLAKNEELQLGDWKNMSLDEKKAAYYLAWGPVVEPDYSFRYAVAFRTALFVLASYLIYASAMSYFRSKKQTPTLTKEWKEANIQRQINERMNPYSGASAPLFTKEGIKKPEDLGK